MNLESVNTLASVATCVVIAATAVAAMIQLRHIRHGNQLQSIIALRALRDSPRVDEAFNFVAHDLESALKDPQFRAELADLRPPLRSVHKELVLCDYFEQVGSYVKYGLISAEVFLDYANPERYWKLCKEALALYRLHRGPQTYENFEYLVVLAQDWDRSHADGYYPKGYRRLTLPSVEADSTTETASRAQSHQ